MKYFALFYSGLLIALSITSALGFVQKREYWAALGAWLYIMLGFFSIVGWLQ